MSAPAPHGPAPHRPRALTMLGAGALFGLALAVLGLFGEKEPGAALPEGAVALVNGKAILEEDYLRLLAGLDADTRGPVSRAQKRRLLERMIDEELLVQRGLELGLADSDRRIRAEITSAMIRSAVLEAGGVVPSRRELEEFYEREGGLFRAPGRVWVESLFFSAAAGEAEALRRARLARARLAAGEPAGKLREELADPGPVPIPAALLPPTKLREYIGPDALAEVMKLESGEVAGPLHGEAGLQLLRVRSREAPRLPPFEEVREQVRTEWQRRADDRALRAYLDRLRRHAELRVRAELP